MSLRPSHRGEFKVAIICALPLEYDAVHLTFDEVWDEGQYGRAEGDFNNYTTGRMGKCNVVLTLLSGVGKANAASAAASLRSSFSGLCLALVVGICGASPYNEKMDSEILLGDVIISKIAVQHDFGRQYPGKFVRKDAIEEVLGRPNKELRSLLIMFETEWGLEKLERRTAAVLKELQVCVTGTKSHSKYAYPGIAEDKLFEATYRHKHQASPTCVCRNWCHDSDPVCDEALVRSCAELGCSDERLVTRQRLQAKSQEAVEIAQQPAVHLGAVASGDIVLKSAVDRDKITKDTHAIGFEMESAGVWDEVPCIVIKGACDYADSHKNNIWQHFAAATAASTTKAIVEQYIPAYPGADTPVGVSQTLRGHPVHHIQPRKNPKFVGRVEVIRTLQQMLFEQDEVQRVAIVGLGGIGKTQVALQIAYWTVENKPDYSVFWLPAYSIEGFEQGYRQIANKLAIQIPQKEDAKDMVQRYLSSGAAGKWLIIVDNADDMDEIFGSQGNRGLHQYLPESDDGLILFTTRLDDIAWAAAEDNMLRLGEMSLEEAKGLLEKIRGKGDLDDEVLHGLMDELAYLPLAISQAAAYMKRNQISITEYLKLLRNTEQDFVNLMSRQYHTQNSGTQNAVATTWLVSFNQIRKVDPIAADLLLFISCIEPKGIPRAMLPVKETEEGLANAIGTLLGYAFLSSDSADDMFDMHHLVHLAIRIWAKREDLVVAAMQDAMRHLEESFPLRYYPDRFLLRSYIRHSMKVLEASEAIDSADKPLLYFHTGLYLFDDMSLTKAMKAFKICYELLRATLPEGHSCLIRVQTCILKVYMAELRFEEGLKLLHDIVETIRCGDLRPIDELLSISETAARALREAGFHKESIQVLEDVADVAKAFPEHDYARLSFEISLAFAYKSDGRIKESIEMLEHVARVHAQHLREDNPSRLHAQDMLAQALMEGGQLKRAIEILQQVEAAKSKFLPEDDLHLLRSQVALAEAYKSEGRIKEARNLFEHITEVCLNSQFSDRIAFPTAFITLAELYEQDGDVGQAVELLQRIIAIMSETPVDDDVHLLMFQLELASLYESNGNTTEMVALSRHILACCERLQKRPGGPSHLYQTVITNIYEKLRTSVESVPSLMSDTYTPDK